MKRRDEGDGVDVQMAQRRDVGASMCGPWWSTINTGFCGMCDVTDLMILIFAQVHLWD
jgi:hypothetical protein